LVTTRPRNEVPSSLSDQTAKNAERDRQIEPGDVVNSLLPSPARQEDLAMSQQPSHDGYLLRLMDAVDNKNGDSYQAALMLIQYFCFRVERDEVPNMDVLKYFARRFRIAMKERTLGSAYDGLGFNSHNGGHVLRPIRNLWMTILIKRALLGNLSLIDITENPMVTKDKEQIERCWRTFHPRPEKTSLEDITDFIACIFSVTGEAVRSIYAEYSVVFPEIANAQSLLKLEKAIAPFAEFQKYKKLKEGD
jgi:hypothetical protein